MSIPKTLQEWLQSIPNVQMQKRSEQWLQLLCSAEQLPALTRHLMEEEEAEFATLLVEESADALSVHYLFYLPATGNLIELKVEAPAGTELPAISDTVHAADWHEREAWDLYGLRFSGHPFLGDFVLHDDDWPEGLDPMRRSFDGKHRPDLHGSGADWAPPRLLQEEGAMVFPVGPVWGDFNESGLWLLETPGEQIRYLHTRLFYKYRGVEKIAEGRTVDQGLLLAERFAGASAFAHAWAYCQALEQIAACQVPTRAQQLRIVFAELERIRHHAANIAEIAGSTALSVAKALAQGIVEDLLRLSARLCGHRYFFGVLTPGGLREDLDESKIKLLRQTLPELDQRMQQLEKHLEGSSSFLDRIEEMGTLSNELARIYGVVGPIARASGRSIDLRRHLPYGQYLFLSPDVPVEQEGDGYARLRIFFAESRISVKIILELLPFMAEGPVQSPCPIQEGHALSWVEAPSGATFHWLRCTGDGTITRLRLGTPGFRNWHAFERAIEGAAFQDFPIILATWGLSIAENDR
ncbi:NADH-quinone oxidoreductase subunit C [Acidithiobacillus albertensis]|uniref:NADH-quinone oxidoreductase subunit D-related protein n=1 Tax=Acidithiobacillus albertensis TaxID=119978 RepID=UPI00094AFF7A|nr:NADH-quinone oxidoreductase subunit C [Acidithiobacillus albertensis]